MSAVCITGARPGTRPQHACMSVPTARPDACLVSACACLGLQSTRQGLPGPSTPPGCPPWLPAQSTPTRLVSGGSGRAGRAPRATRPTACRGRWMSQRVVSPRGMRPCPSLQQAARGLARWRTGGRQMLVCSPAICLSPPTPRHAVIPPGSYTPQPPLVSLCPRGQWKAVVGPASTCTACAAGVTTAAEGATSPQNCTLVVPGVYTSAMSGAVVTATRTCPQKHYW